MPCYQVNTVSVEFTGANEALLRAAAELLKVDFRQYGEIVIIGKVNINLTAGKATAITQAEINTVKRAYAQAAVKSAARSKGWNLEQWKQTTNKLQTIAVRW